MRASIQGKHRDKLGGTCLGLLECCCVPLVFDDLVELFQGELFAAAVRCCGWRETQLLHSLDSKFALWSRNSIVNPVLLRSATPVEVGFRLRRIVLKVYRHLS